VIAVKPFVLKDLNMSLQPIQSQRFIRKTQLAPNEYRKNFQQIDREILSAITSAEADAVTPLMSKIYLRMVNAPAKYWEREGVLRIEAEVRDEKLLKAWAVMCDMVGVASATACKALRWMHEQGIIGYFSAKNGVGLRIFLNRASSSIGVRGGRGGEKILAFPTGSSTERIASPNEPAFNDSFAVRETSDPDINPAAPKNGANTRSVDKSFHDSTLNTSLAAPRSVPPYIRVSQSPNVIEDVITRLKEELAPVMHTAARQAAAREHERTREWLEYKGLPKAARVAQHEAYNVLRKYGLVSDASRPPRTRADVGRSSYEPPAPQPISDAEVGDLAQACVAMLETQGKAIEATLTEMSAQAGGFLLAEDAVRVHEKANSLLPVGDRWKGN